MARKSARPAKTVTPPQAPAPAATDLRGICRQAAAALPGHRHGLAVQQVRARLAASGGTARLANIALRIALIRQWQPAPVPALEPAPVEAPTPPKGRVNLMALQDAARMLASVEDDPPAAPAGVKKLAIDFSMFGDDEAGGQDDDLPEPAVEDAPPVPETPPPDTPAEPLADAPPAPAPRRRARKPKAAAETEGLPSNTGALRRSAPADPEAE